jgi:hypothetical protein
MHSAPSARLASTTDDPATAEANEMRLLIAVDADRRINEITVELLSRVERMRALQTWAACLMRTTA